MNKENGIKRLNRLSVKAKEYRDENTQVVKLSQAIEVVELLDQLDEPERVFVPQFVAKYIEIQREYGYENIRIAIKRIEGRGERSRLFNWFFFENNSDLFAKAWIYGYEVENEPKWVVKLGNSYLYEPMADVSSDGLIRLTRNKIEAYHFESKEMAGIHIDKFGGEAEEVQNERKRCENHISQIVHN